MNKKHNEREPHSGVTKERAACARRVRDALFRTGLSVSELVKETTLTEGTVRRALYEEIVTMDTVFAVAKFLKKPSALFFVGEPTDQDVAFKEELWTLAKDVPADKRGPLLEIVEAYKEAVTPPNPEE